MNMLPIQIFWRLRQFENDNSYEHFPGFRTKVLWDYCEKVIQSGQYKVIFGGHFEEPIAFALWWYLPTLEMCENKSWEKPFPNNLDNGPYAYIDIVWANKQYRKFNLVRRMLIEAHTEHPEKHVCFHRLWEGKQYFYHRKPLRLYEKAV